MVDPRTLRRWLFRGVFVLLVLSVVFFQVLPLQVGTGHWPGPDLIVAFAFAWVLRRPGYVPVLLVAIAMLIADFMFLRPPGLWAALTIGGLEFLRGREPTSRDMPFFIEWAMVGGVLLAMVVLYRLVLTLFMVNQASLGLFVLGQISTFAAYPLAVLVSSVVLGIEKITAAEADEMRYAR